MEQKDQERFEHTAKIFRILGHPVRLAMIEELKVRSWCVCELAARLDLNNPTASKHLSLLNSIGVISMDKNGTQVTCTLVMTCIFDMMHCAEITRTQDRTASEGSQKIEISTTYCDAGHCKR
ncbi:MAG: metalloregulator ArsR/SmtB family transcription factor [Spirochaetia bacterium]|nr:metalloregulator ArsR/SmtB family transcription factor [Spirochaetia bacterium]